MQREQPLDVDMASVFVAIGAFGSMYGVGRIWQADHDQAIGVALLLVVLPWLLLRILEVDSPRELLKRSWQCLLLFAGTIGCLMAFAAGIRLAFS